MAFVLNSEYLKYCMFQIILSYFIMCNTITGVARFELANGGVKVHSLTTWRHPKIVNEKLNYIIEILGKKGFEPLTP